MIDRKDIIQEAKSWIGTKFRYQGRIKKNLDNDGGVDCLGLILKICDKIKFTYNNNLLSNYDNISYSAKPDYNILKVEFAKFFNIIPINQIDIGDIILKKVSKEQYHLMFYNNKTVIHASAVAFKVVEHNLDNLNNCIVYSLF